MLLFYLDEFGEGSMKRQRVNHRWVLDPAVAPWFILAGVGIAETMRKDLAEDILEIKDKFFPGWKANPWKDTEIKGRYLHQAVTMTAAGRVPWQAGYQHLTAARARSLCRELARLFRRFRPIVYAVAIDKARHVRHNAPREPEAIAYAFLEQRLALLVDDVYGDTEGALMIADDQQSHEKLFRSGRMLQVRTQITTGLPRQPNFDLVLDRPVWIDPQLHPLDREILQLPDIVCYGVAELLRTGARPAGDAHMWEQVVPCFAYHFTTGEVPDAGVSIYPRPQQGYPQL
jgi:hypothetical protein